MKRYLYKYKTILLILSAVVSSLAFTVDNLGILMWISFIPLIFTLIIIDDSFIKIVKSGTIFGFIYYLIILHWIFNLYPFIKAARISPV